MERSLASYVKGFYETDTAEELLKRPTEALLGVDREAADALRVLFINSVFDLASSHLFSSSHKLALESQGKSSVFDHVGAIPADIVDANMVSMSPSDIALSGIEVLRGIGTDQS